MNTTRLPVQLHVVALIFLLTGLVSLLGMIVGIDGAARLNASLLGIPMFFGLRRLSTGWRTCALLLLGIGMASAVAVFVLSFFVKTSFDFSLFGAVSGSMSSFGAAVASAAVFAFYFWQFRVLTSARVRALFYQHANHQPPVAPPVGSFPQ